MVLVFISEHKKLVIGIVLYLAVAITGIFISPWDNPLFAEEMSQGYGFTNDFMNSLPFELLFSGVAELIESLYYVQSLELSSGFYLFFFFTVCAMFTYTSALKHLILDGADYFTLDMSNMEDLNPVERIAIDYLYDNVGIFLSSVLVRNLYPFVSGKFAEQWDKNEGIVNFLLIFLVVVLIIIPMLPNLIYLLLYMFGAQGIVLLSNVIDANLDWLPFFKTALLLVTAVLLVVILNILCSVVLEFFQKKTVLLIGGIGRSVAEGALGMVGCLVMALLFGGAVAVIMTLKSCIGG